MLAISSSATQLLLEDNNLRHAPELPVPFAEHLDSHELEALRSQYRKLRAPYSRPQSPITADGALGASPAATAAAVSAAAAAAFAVAVSSTLVHGPSAGGARPGPGKVPSCASLPALVTPPAIPSCQSMPVLPPGWAHSPRVAPRAVAPASPNLPSTPPKGKTASATGRVRAAHCQPPAIALPKTVVEPPHDAAQLAAIAKDAAAATAAATLAQSLDAFVKVPRPTDVSGTVDGHVSDAGRDAAEGAVPLSAARLGALFDDCLAFSAQAEAGTSEQLVAYDASDCPTVKYCGPALWQADGAAGTGTGSFKCRLDARRGKKPNPQAAALAADPSTDPNAAVDLLTDPDTAKFNFTKVHPREVLCSLPLAGHQFRVLPNKFPVANRHLLLVDEDIAPQRLTAAALDALAELLQACKPFAASFNSWGAAASVNHLHIHLTDEALPMAAYAAVADGTADNGAPRFRLCGYPAKHRAFRWTEGLSRAALLHQLEACHVANVPYNVAFLPHGLAVVFGRTKAQPEVSWRTYGERLGGFEMAGIFTAYQEDTFARLNATSVAAMLDAGTTVLPGA